MKNSQIILQTLEEIRTELEPYFSEGYTIIW